jgi:hypothetical protein
MTDCIQQTLAFQAVGSHRVEMDFEGGEVTSDAGALLLGEADSARRILGRFARRCFIDSRNRRLVIHSLESLLRQRVFGLALGYEDVNDHETLRGDAALRTLCGVDDPKERLAGKSTLNRVEVSAGTERRNARYHKIAFDPGAFHGLLRDLFFEAHAAAPAEIVLDLDATDFVLHGSQEGRYYQGYYRDYCYLPLYIFCGGHLLHAELRPSNIDASLGSIEAAAPIVAAVRKRWPACRIIVRGDSGFCRDDLMDWCERRGVSYILGKPQDKRLRKRCARRMEQARRRFLRTGEAARLYTSFGHRTRKSWSARRRVVAKCEHLAKGANPRFIVTNLLGCEIGNREIYEKGYCLRGDMENRIMEQLELFADRSSCTGFAANQLRMALSSMAYVLMNTLRGALAGTALEKAHPNTIRLRLLKIGARVRTSVRRILFSCASGYPWRETFLRCHKNLRALGASP